jgi:hypothetical protein
VIKSGQNVTSCANDNSVPGSTQTATLASSDDKRWAHHDALEFPDGEIVLLTLLKAGQDATVLQLPAAAVGSKAPQPAAYA